MILHDYLPSGNGHKVRQILAKLGQPYQLVLLDILQGQTRTPAFLAKNPNGRIPCLELPDGRCLSESNAILFYLGQNSRYWPPDPFDQAKVMQWLFFEQYSHEPMIATLRFWVSILKDTQGKEAEIAHKTKWGHAALAVMEAQLQKSSYLVGESITLADLALYAYTHVAPEGGFDLGAYPQILDWLARVESDQPHVRITDPHPHGSRPGQ